MGRKRLLNKPAKGINLVSTNGPGLGRADRVFAKRESRAQRRQREADERRTERKQ